MVMVTVTVTVRVTVTVTTPGEYILYDGSAEVGGRDVELPQGGGLVPLGQLHLGQEEGGGDDTDNDVGMADGDHDDQEEET